MQTLEQAQETNRRLNRRLQQLEGPNQSKIDKLSEALTWSRATTTRLMEENDGLQMRLFAHWVWHVAAAFLIAALIFWR